MWRRFVCGLIPLAIHRCFGCVRGRLFWHASLDRMVPSIGIHVAEEAVTTGSQGRWQVANVPPGDDVILRLKVSQPAYSFGSQAWENAYSSAWRERRRCARTGQAVGRFGIRIGHEVLSELSTETSPGNHAAGADCSSRF